jgi:hypothetical protein
VKAGEIEFVPEFKIFETLKSQDQDVTLSEMAPRAETKPAEASSERSPSNRRGGGRGEARGAAFFFIFFGG